jgi:hypothetical protein
METIDHIVIFALFLLGALWALDMFGKGIFEKAATPAGISSCLTVIGSVYLIAGGIPWITGACAFLALAYLITAFALKGSK